jgi:hypothetical protein
MPETGERTVSAEQSAPSSFRKRRQKLTILDGSVVSDDGVLHGVVPETAVHEVTKEPRVDDLELSGEDSARVDVAVGRRVSVCGCGSDRVQVERRAHEV